MIAVDMPKLSANLTLLFGEVEFLERFRLAADAGFKGVECQFPYAHDPLALHQQLADHGLVQVLHNMPAGNWEQGERGIACLPDRVTEFEAGVEQAVDYASALDCRHLNCLAGIPPPDLDLNDARATLVSNLRYAARRLKAAGLTLLIEPLNTRDVPGFFLSGSAQALDIISDVGVDNLSLQYDAYHMHIMEGDLVRTIERSAAHIAHIQIADFPGRHEPGTGDIDYTVLLPFLDRIGYAGWVGCEYVPRAGTMAGLDWARPYFA